MANSNVRRPRKYSDADLDNLAKHILNFLQESEFPLIINAELEVDVYDGEFCDLARRYPHHENFGRAYRALEKKQKAFLAGKGLTKDHDSSLTKFFLSACHGMTEKQHIVTESVESCIEADESEIEKAEAFEKSRKKVEI